MRFVAIASWAAFGLLVLASGEASAQGSYTPVTEAEVVRMSFNHYFTPEKKYQSPDFTWKFTKTDFTLKKGTGAIPADLTRKLLPEGVVADEIQGKWKLANKDGQWLVFTEIKAGKTVGNSEAKLPIYKTAPTVIRIGQTQYVFGLIQ